MKSNFSFLQFLIVSYLVFFATEANASKSLDSYTKDFEHAKSTAARLKVCIDAINDGVIHQGNPSKNIDQIFSQHNGYIIVTNSDEIQLDPKPKKGYLIPGAEVTKQNPVKDFVYFEQPKAKVRANIHGWYFTFYFDKSRRILDYALTDFYPWSSYSAVQELAGIDELSHRYQLASDADARMQVCIDAINAKAIQRGAPIANIFKIMNLPANRARPSYASGKFYDKIYFHDESSLPDDGWYFAYTANSDNGTVENYWLSNTARESGDQQNPYFMIPTIQNQKNSLPKPQIKPEHKSLVKP